MTMCIVWGGVFVLVCCVAAVSHATPLSLRITGEDETLRLDAELGHQTTSYQVNGLQDLQTLYLQLETDQVDEHTFAPLLRTFGAQVFDPIASLMASASEIEFVIAAHLLRLPLDLLYVNQQPLFLQRPVTYCFAKTKRAAPEFSFARTLSALIISDQTADPDKGAYFLKQLLPASAEYYDSNAIHLRQLQALPPTDLLLLSVHSLGDECDDAADALKLGDEEIVPEHLARLAPKLVYIDACQFGVSDRFMQHFRNAGTIYYLAPITSNEIGVSSTKTIRWFFQAFQSGSTPPRALFLARRKLYAYFKPRGDFASLLWRAFPFRIYRLN